MATYYEDSGLRARAHHFGSPARNILQMLAFVGLAGFIAYYVRDTLEQAFLASPWINTAIVGAFGIGVIVVFVQVLDVGGAVGWIKRYQSSNRLSDGLVERAPYALKPMAELLRETPSDRRLSSLSARTILDSVGSRLAEAGEITRYLRSLLIFLGLFGSFWGLMETLAGVAAVVNELANSTGDGGGDVGALFAQLTGPLRGMGIAFSSSVLGIAGSLILGFLELQAGQAQGRFYNDLEDWLAKISRVGVDVGEGGSGAFTGALLEQLTESLDALVSVTRKVEDSRARSSDTLGALAAELSTLNDRLARQDDALATLKERALDDTLIRHLRSIDVTLQGLAGDQSVERETLFRDLRTELRALAKTIDAAINRTDRR
jgi:hypothetical protein